MNRSKGAYALVTGASSGIGRAIAHQLAKRGYNLVLTGRNEKALSLAAAACAEQYGVETRVETADLSNPEHAAALANRILTDGCNVEVLVNNAGFGVFGAFADTDLSAETQMVNVHVLSAMILTKKMLPNMIRNNKGHIAFVSSLYAFAPVPYQSVYGAAKSFLYSFSMAVREETASTGVSVTAVCPGTVATRFRKPVHGPKSAERGMPPEEAARIACDALFKRRRLCVPGWKNRFFHYLSWVVSPVWLVKTVNRFRGMNAANADKTNAWGIRT